MPTLHRGAISDLDDHFSCLTQYTLMRTPAALFFPEPLQRSLEDALLAFGEARLGCGGVSQVWLAYYVDGMRQVSRCCRPEC